MSISANAAQGGDVMLSREPDALAGLVETPRWDAHRAASEGAGTMRSNEETEGATMTDTNPQPTYSRRFYVLWFALFTVVSMLLNGAHAFMFAPRAWAGLHPDIAGWLAVDGHMPTWFALTAVSVALIPPVGLACATHALVTPDPTTTSGRGTGARTTTWTIALAALTLSTVMITDLVRMLLGVPVALAVLVPLIVDVSIVAAVLRLEIRRRGHAVEAHVEPQVVAGSDASPGADAARHGAPSRADDAPSVARQGATPTRVTTQPDAPVRRTPRRTGDAVTTLSDPASVAAQLVRDGRTTAPVEDVVQALELVAEGTSKREVARIVPSVGSEASVRRLLKAAQVIDDAAAEVEVTADPAEPDSDAETERMLAAVG